MPRRAWTLDEVRDLQTLFGSRTNARLARRFGCTVEEIEAKAAELALAKNKACPAFKGRVQMPRWSAVDLERLRSLYPDRTNREIARALGRSVKSVTSKAWGLGLCKDQARMSAMGRENRAKRRPRG